MTTLVLDYEKELKQVRAEYRGKLRELRQRQKEALANLYAAYYFAVDEEERAAIEAKILEILENERKDNL